MVSADVDVDLDVAVDVVLDLVLVLDQPRCSRGPRSRSKSRTRSKSRSTTTLLQLHRLAEHRLAVLLAETARRHERIVLEYEDAVVLERLGHEDLLLLVRRHRQRVVRHHPARPQVRVRRDDVAAERHVGAVAVEARELLAGGVALRRDDLDVGEEPGVALDEVELVRAVEELEVLGAEAPRVLLRRRVRELPRAALHVVRRAGEGELEAAALAPPRRAAGVVELQMGEHHVRHRVAPEPEACQPRVEPALRAVDRVDVRPFGVPLVPDAVVDEDDSPRVAVDRDEAAAGEADAVPGVRRDLALPERARDDAEHGAAVEGEPRVHDARDLVTADAHAELLKGGRGSDSTVSTHGRWAARRFTARGPGPLFPERGPYAPSRPLERAPSRHRRLVRGPRRVRAADPRRGAADPDARRHRRRQGGAHGRGHPARPERLAVDRRAGGRVGLGPRRVRGAGLDGGLAPPRGAPRARSLVPRRGRGGLRGAPRGAAGGAPGAARPDAPREHLGCRHRDARHRSGARRRVRRARRPLRRRLRERPRRLRDPRRLSRGSWPPARAGGVLLVDELGVGDRPTGGAVVWSVVSFVLLLAGIGALAWYHGGRQEPIAVEDHPERDPLFGLRPTPSQRATVKYFWTAAALLVVQIALGAVTAHYAVEGSGFYGFPLAKVLPYAVTRTWHTQLGIFWIATAWLATGLYMGPAVSGVEPRGQRALVLFCLRALRPGAAWRERPVAAAFWLINGGLALMVLLSLLPVGILQTWAAVETGTWWARSSDFMQQPLMNVLRWLRIPGDTIFAIGALVLGWFVLGLATGWSLEKGGRHVDEGSTEVRDAAPAPGRA